VSVVATLRLRGGAARELVEAAREPPARTRALFEQLGVQQALRRRDRPLVIPNEMRVIGA
jgi:hypothetical protein